MRSAREGDTVGGQNGGMRKHARFAVAAPVGSRSRYSAWCREEGRALRCKPGDPQGPHGSPTPKDADDGTEEGTRKRELRTQRDALTEAGAARAVAAREVRGDHPYELYPFASLGRRAEGHGAGVAGGGIAFPPIPPPPLFPPPPIRVQTIPRCDTHPRAQAQSYLALRRARKNPARGAASRIRSAWLARSPPRASRWGRRGGCQSPSGSRTMKESASG